MKKEINLQHQYIKKWFLILILFVSGCTYKQPIHEINLKPINDRIKLTVGLHITNEFRSAILEPSGGGVKNTTAETAKDRLAKEGPNAVLDGYILPIGDNLAYQAEQLTKRVFTNSVLLEESVNSTQNTNVKYVMTPKVNFIEHTPARTPEILISVEWKLTDQSGKIVWVDSITGVGSESASAFSNRSHTETRFKKALQDLFDKSQSIMLCSRVLRNLK